jgi:tetratricopeptide (TPR) repeat protein
MTRNPVAGAAVLATLFLASVTHAQDVDVEEKWKTLFMQALYAAGANDYPKAEQIFLSALKEAERFGSDDARVGTTINSLGLVYRSERKYSEAEVAYRRALTILAKDYGDDSIDVANVNFNIATVMFDQGHQSSAMPFLQRTLTTYESMLGTQSLKTATVFCMIGDAYRLDKDPKQAEGPLRQCADIRESEGGMENSELADALHSLALVYQFEGKYALAEPRFTLAEKIREKTLGITSPLLAQTMEDHASLLKQMGRDKEAARLTTIASAIRRTEKNSDKKGR